VIDCTGCMAVLGPMGRMTVECERLLLAGVCQKQMWIRAVASNPDPGVPDRRAGHALMIVQEGIDGQMVSVPNVGR